MDYNQAAMEVFKHIGGKENIVSVTHCATRLRLVLCDKAKCDKDSLEQIDGVKGIFEASGQLQIIFGKEIVDKIYNEFILILGMREEDKKTEQKAELNLFIRIIKTFSNILLKILR